MPSYLAHLITDPNAPVTAEWCAAVEALKRATPGRVQRARRAEIPTGTGLLASLRPTTERAAPCGNGNVNALLAEWWGEGPGEGVSITACIRQGAQAFPEISRADFIATLVSKGVNKATAGIQFKKGREGHA